MASRASGGRERERDALWAAIVALAALLGFLLGYQVSSRTGSEPGYFEAPEAGGYGAAPAPAPKGDEVRRYYEELLR